MNWQNVISQCGPNKSLIYLYRTCILVAGAIYILFAPLFAQRFHFRFQQTTDRRAKTAFRRATRSDGSCHSRAATRSACANAAAPHVSDCVFRCQVMPCPVLMSLLSPAFCYFLFCFLQIASSAIEIRSARASAATSRRPTATPTTPPAARPATSSTAASPVSSLLLLARVMHVHSS